MRVKQNRNTLVLVFMGFIIKKYNNNNLKTKLFA